MNELLREEFLQEIGISYKKRGDKLLFLCPYHKEKNPSCYMYKEGNIYCYGCLIKKTWSEFLLYSGFEIHRFSIMNSETQLEFSF